MKKFLPVVFVLGFSVPQSFAQVNVQDSLALVALYNSTNGAGWTNKTNWLSGPVNTWYGVTVDNSNEIQFIILNDNNLNGTIPSDLETLPNLSYLNLSHNNLTGSIPQNLKIWSAIAVNYNQLSGPIPAGFCEPALYLFLDNNQFTFEGMECIGENDQARPPMSEEQYFYDPQKGLIITNNNPVLSVTAGGTLSNNTYTWYKDDGATPYATHTGDSTLMLSETGTYWGVVRNSLANKLILYTDTIAITTVLTMLQRDSLALMDIYNSTNGAGWTNNTNWLADKPVAEWAGVTVTNDRITAIDLSNNNLSGEIFRIRGPASYSARISDFFGALANLSGLTALSLADNNLSGSLPASIANLVNLEYLSLEKNHFSGMIPPGICSLPNLNTINISNNQFTFDGMECIAAIPGATYASQKTLAITNNHPSLSVTAGGALSKNTYTWFKDDVLYDSNAEDSALTITEQGTYRVEVANSDATQLILKSSPIIVSILPLTWLSFTASNCSENVCLQWQTENEQNTSHFEIERSVDGKNFMQLSKIASQNIPGAHVYNATDDSPAYGTNYYRIRQVDIDGTYSYSDIRSVKVMNAGKLIIRPNPANNFIVLSGIDKAERVVLYSITGQMLHEWRHVNDGQQLNISDLQKGMYIIKVLHHNGEAVHKIIRQ